jgi:RNA polymerase sigma factor (sigma-70 family)
MTPEEEKVFLECSKLIPGLVYKTLGFSDEDFGQDAQEAMLKSIPNYQSDQGATLKTWLLLKARFQVVDSFRRKNHLRRNGVRPQLVAINEIKDRYGGGSIQLEAELDRGFQDAEDKVDADLTKERTEEILKTFSHTHQSIIRARLLGHKMAAIGHAHEVTESRVSQIMKTFRKRYRGNEIDQSKELLRQK